MRSVINVPNQSCRPATDALNTGWQLRLPVSTSRHFNKLQDSRNESYVIFNLIFIE